MTPTSCLHRSVSPLNETAKKKDPHRMCDWKIRLDQLRQYKKEHGDVNVLKSCKGFQGLAEWVEQQRHQYKLSEEGKSSDITLDLIYELESLGFQWNLSDSNSSLEQPLHFHRPISKNEKKFWSQWEAHGTKETARAWHRQFDQLKQYKKEHGNCEIPKNNEGDSKLRTWVAYQRKQYRLFKQSKWSNLSQRRKEKLESLDFVSKKEQTEELKMSPCSTKNHRSIVTNSRITASLKLPSIQENDSNGKAVASPSRPLNTKGTVNDKLVNNGSSPHSMTADIKLGPRRVNARSA